MTLERARADARARLPRREVRLGRLSARAPPRTTPTTWSAAREGLGSDGLLLIDAGQIWGDDVERAAERLPALQAAQVTWLEEPFVPHAFGAHAALAGRSGSVGLAGGEGAHNVHMATNLIDFGGVRFIQIDAGPDRRHRRRPRPSPTTRWLAA